MPLACVNPPSPSFPSNTLPPVAAAAAGAHNLVPLYACHLRAGLRHMTYQIFFEQLVAQVSAVGGWGSDAGVRVGGGGSSTGGLKGGGTRPSVRLG